MTGKFTPQHFGKHYLSLVLRVLSFDEIEELMAHYAIPSAGPAT